MKKFVDVKTLDGVASINIDLIKAVYDYPHDTCITRIDVAENDTFKSIESRATIILKIKKVQMGIY